MFLPQKGVVIDPCDAGNTVRSVIGIYVKTTTLIWATVHLFGDPQVGLVNGLRSNIPVALNLSVLLGSRVHQYMS